MSLELIDNGIYAKESAKTAISQAQCIFFDCDGVLVDVSASYDETIKESVDILLERFANIQNPVPVTRDIIEKFKASGGFNDEIDLAYALSLCIVSASKSNNPLEYVMQIADNADSTGLKSVQKYLSTDAKVQSFSEKLAYPGDGSGGIVYDIFDSIFYGTELYSSMGRMDAGISKRSGLIDHDKIIMDANLAPSLQTHFGRKPGIVTGRGMRAIQYTLGDLLNGFDVKNSAFLEDKPRNMAKPNPESLIQCMDAMGIDHAIFVGDSAEDLILSKRASDAGKKVTFCGIIGTSRVPEKKLELFNTMGADAAMDSVLHMERLIKMCK